MLVPEEISQFFEGELGGALVLRYDGSHSEIRLKLVEKETLVAYIPIREGESDTTFSIEAALIHPMCDAKYTTSEKGYEVEIKKRFQVRSVIKIALSHLGWEDEKRLHTEFV